MHMARAAGSRLVRVHLTFDVEVWCAGWDRLDQSFPAAFERYVWGRSKSGDYALPRNLEILRRYGLSAVFFVEPLFSHRFGAQHLRTIVDLIQSADQDVQLHIHPEWVDEISPGLIPDCAAKRQHLTLYTRDEQRALIVAAKQALAAASGRPVDAFRSGGYSVNLDTYRALADAGIRIDSSLNPTYNYSGGSLGSQADMAACQRIEGVEVHPVSVFQDGFGRLRHLQIGACSFAEMKSVLDQAHEAGVQEVVLVSHNFELLKPGRQDPDRVVERRFDALCAYLARHPERFAVQPFKAGEIDVTNSACSTDLHTGYGATVRRLVEQAVRRLG